MTVYWIEKYTGMHTLVEWKKEQWKKSHLTTVPYSHNT